MSYDCNPLPVFTQRSPGETEPSDSDELHVDHIFPSQPSAEACAESGLTKETAELLVGLPGNLTFLSAKPNISMSNGPLSIKKRKSAELESLPLTKDLATVETWNTTAINARTERLFHLALIAWPNVQST